MQLSTNYENLSLGELAEKLDADFYRSIGRQCLQAAEQGAHESKAVIGLIGELMQAKQELLVGYLKELAEKSSTGHDCSTCSGGCDMGHAARIMEIRESHVIITDHIAGIDINEIPEVLLPITMALTRLIDVEANVLIPQIWNAQRKINVAG